MFLSLASHSLVDLHRERTLSYMLFFSFFLHLVFFSMVALISPRPVSPPVRFQSYQVALVSMPPRPAEQPMAPVVAPIETNTPPVENEVKQETVSVIKTIKNAEPAPVATVPNVETMPPLESDPKIAPAPSVPVPAEGTPTGTSSLEREKTVSTPVAPTDATATASVGIVGGEGAGQSGLAAPGPLFQFPYYLRAIESKISAQWAPPPTKKQTGTVVVIVGFTVKRNGQIEAIAIEESSGNSFFDTSALRAIFNASPLSPLPKGITEDLRVHFRFAMGVGS